MSTKREWRSVLTYTILSLSRVCSLPVGTAQGSVAASESLQVSVGDGPWGLGQSQTL